jgi:hypothetical protein
MADKAQSDPVEPTQDDSESTQNNENLPIEPVQE